MHPAFPNKKQNHLQNSLLRLTQFWVRKTFSKPASLKKGLPSCLSGRHKPQSFIQSKTLRFCNPKNLKNEPKHGWDHMHSSVKQQKKSTFTVSFSGPSGGTKNETAKNRKIHSEADPCNKQKITTAFIKRRAYRVGTEEARTCIA